MTEDKYLHRGKRLGTAGSVTYKGEKHKGAAGSKGQTKSNWK